MTMYDYCETPNIEIKLFSAISSNSTLSLHFSCHTNSACAYILLAKGRLSSLIHNISDARSANWIHINQEFLDYPKQNWPKTISISTTGFLGKEAWRPPPKWNTRFFFVFSRRTQLWLSLVWRKWENSFGKVGKKVCPVGCLSLVPFPSNLR